jgi:hypothetical protein
MFEFFVDPALPYMMRTEQLRESQEQQQFQAAIRWMQEMATH